MNRQEFIANARSAAAKTSTQSGFPVGLTVAQAVLESNWGESQLSRAANNYFGIKAHGKHRAMEFRTNEVVDGVVVQVVARFAAYENMEDCFRCRDQLIKSGTVYAEVRAAKADPAKFARELGRHWATDPKYAEKLLHIYKEQGFDGFDQNSSK